VGFDRRVIIDALAASRWNKRRAAAALGISRPTLYRRMKEYGIPMKSPPIVRDFADPE
jgi:transcriptional regulator of acetoin/glycerol metabolism